MKSTNNLDSVLSSPETAKILLFCKRCKTAYPVDVFEDWVSLNGKVVPTCPKCHKPMQKRISALKAERKKYPVVQWDTFGLFCDRVIELINRTFTPMYRRVFERYWNNSMFARMRKPYYFRDSMNGYYETYIPTLEDPEGFNMRYYRIVIKTLPELDKTIMKKEEQKLRYSKVANGRGPMGRIDSQLIVLIAPKLTREAAEDYKLHKTKAKSLPRGHRSRPGYFTWIGIHKIPETIVKRLLKFIANFVRKRLRALIKSFKLESLIGIYRESSLYYLISSILEKRNLLPFANTVRCLHHTLNWIRMKIRDIWGYLGREAMIRAVISKVKKSREVDEIRGLLNKIRFSSSRYLKNSEDPPILKPLIQALC